MAGRLKKVYQFKITLKGIKPPIWRRIQVPSTYTFWDFHVAIQDAMGWYDCHLHQFTVFHPQWCEDYFIGIPAEENWGDVEVEPGWKKRLSSFFSDFNPKAIYEYDFGDSWTHQVLLEQILPMDSDLSYPRCIAGKRACPPEDCGGIWGYESLLDILQDPTHEEYESQKEWLGGDFDPEAFDPAKVTFDDPQERYKISISGEL